MRLLTIVAFMLACAPDARADRAAAKKLADKAVKEHYKAGRWRAALTAYQAALDQDPGYAKLHYYIASAASIIGDFERAHDALLAVANAADEGDKEAKRLLKLAATDPDLDRASVNPPVRELLGLPALNSLPLDKQLLERKGIWSLEYNMCGWESVTLTFKKGGKLTCTSVASCNDASEAPACKGTWEIQPDGSINLRFKSAPDVDKELDFSVLTECASGPGCFQLRDGTQLHRGKPDGDQPDPATD